MGNAPFLRNAPQRQAKNNPLMLALGIAGCTFQGFNPFRGKDSSFNAACPSTPVAFGVARGMRITTVASASCNDVLAEINARVNGQSGVWHAPHNNGTYHKQSYGGSYSASRVTGDGKYTDKMIFTLTPGESSSSCKLEACSRSHDFSVATELTESFQQSNVDLKACLKV